MRSRLRRIGGLVVASCTLVLIAAPSAGAALSAGYSSAPTEDPATANPADHFGANIVNAGDVNKDGRDDLMVGVPDAPGGLPKISGKVVFVDGQTGGIISAVVQPSSDTLISHVGASTNFGAQVVTLGDIGSCSGSGNCSVGPKDGYPEHVVTAPGSDISSNAVDMGIAYVLDGKTNDVLKRIELAPDDRPATSPGFGKSATTAGGEPACSGFGGTATCPDSPGSLIATADIDAGGAPDVLIGAPDYQEDAAAETNPSACPLSGPATCPGLGRVYIYRGEDMTGASNTILTNSIPPIQYFDNSNAASQPHFGAALSPLGDVGTCQFDEVNGPQPPNANCITPPAGISPSGAPDGYPDFLASVPGIARVFVIDGKHGVAIASIASPDAQQGSGFGPPPANQQNAPGNLGASYLPDMYLSATGQDGSAGAGQGRGFVFTDAAAPNLIARLDDPAASAGAGYGTFASLGDVAGSDALNEVALGRLHGGPVQILSSCGGLHVIQTIDDPAPGNGFGASIAPLGDLNQDGYLDLGVGAPDANGGNGRVYRILSNGAAGPDPSCNPPTGGGGGGGGSGGGGSGGGGTTTTPPKRGKVSTLAKRKISLRSNKKQVKVAAVVNFKGLLRATKKKGSCQTKVKIAIQRFQPDGRFWATIDVAVSNKKGSFSSSTAVAPASTYYYRAHVNQTKRCAVANSRRVAVTAKG